MRCLYPGGTHRDEILHHPLKLPLKEGTGVIGVGDEGVAMNLSLACNEVIQQRDSDSAKRNPQGSRAMK